MGADRRVSTSNQSGAADVRPTTTKTVNRIPPSRVFLRAKLKPAMGRWTTQPTASAPRWLCSVVKGTTPRRAGPVLVLVQRGVRRVTRLRECMPVARRNQDSWIAGAGAPILAKIRASCACSFPASTRHQSTSPPCHERRTGSAFSSSRVRPISRRPKAWPRTSALVAPPSLSLAMPMATKGRPVLGTC